MEKLLKNNNVNVYDYNSKNATEFRKLLIDNNLCAQDFDVNELHYLISQKCMSTQELTINQLVEQFARGYLVLEELNAQQLLDLLKYI